MRMTARMAPRGPDGESLWQSPDGRVVLGHRRLAIIDLSPAGAQPMADPETGNVIVFDGEIYNYRELRAELESAGSRFRYTDDGKTLRFASTVKGCSPVGLTMRRALFLPWELPQVMRPQQAREGLAALDVDATLLRRWLPIAAHRVPLNRQQLLEAADARVAAVVGAQPKSGFSVPVVPWLAESRDHSRGGKG